MQRYSHMLGIFALVLPLSLMTTSHAQAAETKLTSAVELRSGPSHDFPAVKRLAKGLRMEVHGCLNSWDWCDVTWRGARGWVPANILEFQREDMRLPVGRYGTALGVPEVTFSLGRYWDAYYNDTPWYADRDMWTQRTDAGY